LTRVENAVDQGVEHAIQRLAINFWLYVSSTVCLVCVTYRQENNPRRTHAEAAINCMKEAHTVAVIDAVDNLAGQLTLKVARA